MNPQTGVPSKSHSKTFTELINGPIGAISALFACYAGLYSQLRGGNTRAVFAFTCFVSFFGIVYTLYHQFPGLKIWKYIYTVVAPFVNLFRRVRAFSHERVAFGIFLIFVPFVFYYISTELVKDVNQERRDLAEASVYRRIEQEVTLINADESELRQFYTINAKIELEAAVIGAGDSKGPWIGFDRTQPNGENILDYYDQFKKDDHKNDRYLHRVMDWAPSNNFESAVAISITKQYTDAAKDWTKSRWCQVWRLEKIDSAWRISLFHGGLLEADAKREFEKLKADLLK